ncbi:hypothetical protein B0H16DRAFT_1734292 [Mycena metata]|uniref:Uncharacterized protein n=1 Tax=Mycena metata TaxID=1033252 RepID=A0AAD7HVR4_9AGAR|nr:hypothetical protein B0H16DRAFT_1734292 [Mycena metata]
MNSLLRKDMSEAKWEAMVKEAERIMRVYNRSLQTAIEADKEARPAGGQKTADLMKADMMTEYFPSVQNILEDASSPS